MKQLFKYGIVLLLIVGLAVGTINVFANPSSDKKIVLSDKYTGKKLDRIKSSINQKNNYRFLIHTIDSFEEVSKYFETIDKKIKIKDYSNGNYMLKLAHNSELINKDEIDNGILPTIIGKYSIVQPEVLEFSSYLDGEETTKLWGNNLIGADLFQEELSTKDKVKVAILDTGIDYSNTDLDDNYNDNLSYDFVNEDSDAMDDNGHGTQVAGIIGAEVNSIGRYGVNANSDLVSLKVLDTDGLGTSYDILEAIDYAKQNGIKVINMSFGGIGNPETSSVCSAITEAKANGIFTIVSAGNTNSDITNIIPAGCSDSIVVGAIDQENNKTNFSNYGTGVIYAPGIDIYTTSINNNYTNVAGTSFSAAFVSGLVSKELAFSGSINYYDVLSNIKNNYNLLNSIDNIENITQETETNLIEYASGVYINKDNFFLYERFDDFIYLNSDSEYIYYQDKLIGDKIYRLKINSDFIFQFEENYVNNPKIAFSDKRNFDPLYFNSGEYIEIEDYPYSDTFPIVYKALEQVSIGKYDLNLKLNKLSSGQEIDVNGTIYFIDNLYVYYINNNNYGLYRKARDGTDGTSDGKLLVSNSYSYPYSMDEDYIYFQNSGDYYKYYRVKKDGTELTRIISINIPYILLDKDGYFYYFINNSLYKTKKDGTETIEIVSNVRYFQKSEGDFLYYNGTDSSLYRVLDDGSGIITGGTKIVNGLTSVEAFDEEYLYYFDRRDYSNFYKIKKDGSEVSIGGLKLNNTANGYPTFLFKDNDYLYYFLDNGGIYKTDINGLNSDSYGIKIVNKFIDLCHFNIDRFLLDGEYLYYIDSYDSDKIYKVKVDGSEVLSGGTLISDYVYNKILFLEDEYIYLLGYGNNANVLYKVNKNSLENIDIDNNVNSYISNDFNYIYYVKYNYSSYIYSLYRVKKDPTNDNYDTNPVTYLSPEINVGRDLTNLQINVDSLIPVGTNYNFYLANQKTQDILIEANEYGVDMYWTYIYLFGDTFNNGTRQDILSKINVGDSIYLDKNGNIGKFEVEYKDYWSIRVVYNGQDLWDYYGAKIYTSGINYIQLDNSKLDGNTSLDLNSIFGLTTDKLYYKIELFGDENDATKTPVINSVEFKEVSSLSVPNTLKQYIQSPGLDKEIFGSGTELGAKIGKFQSGSGIILSADVGNNEGSNYKLVFEIYKHKDEHNMSSTSTLSSNYVTSGISQLTIPYLGAGDYSWRVRTEDSNGYFSDWVSFTDSYTGGVDYSLFEGFEPYPYGYDFNNRAVNKDILTGGVKYIYDLNDINAETVIRIKEDGRRWDIFNSAFDLSIFDNNENALMDAFVNTGMNRSNLLQNGSCYGMSISSIMQLKKPNYMEQNYASFFNKVGNGTIWDKMSSPSSSIDAHWDIYNETLDAITAMQVTQYSGYHQNLFNSGTTTADKVLEKLETNPNNTYILLFAGIDIDGNENGHAVVPYRTEGNKIYFWDNNNPYDKLYNYSPYNQYIELIEDENGNIGFEAHSYIYDKDNRSDGFVKFTEIVLVDINDIYNGGKKVKPIGFNENETMYTLSGSSNLYVEDSLGRVSGFFSGSIVKEIPGVDVIIPLYDSFTGSTENTWKQIYLPQKQDLTVKVSADIEESYDLMVAGGDYYTKISGVETNSGQVDSFISTRENLQIDFDDNKIGDYNLLIDNFHDSGTGTIYMDNVESKIEPQQYIVSWTGVIDNTSEAVIYEVDTNNDGTFDESINLPPVYQDNISPTTNYSFSGELNSNSTGSYIETLSIELNSIDNDGGTGVDSIYYAIGTDTGSLIYLAYTETILINGVGDYTLNYYAVDKFGNIEETKTVNFTLVERPETYAGNISGYVYDDENNNGLEDEGEKRMAGWKVCIDLNNNNDCEEQTEPFNLTNNDGYYEFDSLETGVYKILEIPHQNWEVTNNSGYYDINLSNGEVVTGKDFGNYKVKSNNK